MVGCSSSVMGEGTPLRVGDGWVRELGDWLGGVDGACDDDSKRRDRVIGRCGTVSFSRLVYLRGLPSA